MEVGGQRGRPRGQGEWEGLHISGSVHISLGPAYSYQVAQSNPPPPPVHEAADWTRPGRERDYGGGAFRRRVDGDGGAGKGGGGRVPV